MQSTHEPTLYLFCGRIGSGKSTLARSLAARPATLLVSEDHWTSNLFAGEMKTVEDYGRLSLRLCTAMAPHIVSILQQGISVALDFQGNTVQRRGWLRSLFTQANVAHELHWLDVPDAICRQRLHERNARGDHPFQVSEVEYEQFARYFVAPDPAEGFNVLVHRS